MSGPQTPNFTRRALRYGASAAVLALAVIAAPPTALAAGQSDATPDQTKEVKEVVVTGVRRALQTAQQIKRNSDTVQDTITASDIGAFPDKSIAESLQRVPGITVNRFAASDDTSHFSAEPSGVLVRGLPQVRNEFNGRDAFSANSGRGLGWGDVSPELMSQVDVYKNLTADLIEGGIAGTVDLHTRVPFDQAGSVKALSVNANYGDLSKKWTPEASGLLSGRWDTDIGEFGLLGNLAYSEVKSRSEGVQYGETLGFKDLYGPGIKYIPDSLGYRDVNYDRTRKGVSVAGQWQDHDHKFLLTAQYNRSSYDEVWKEHGIIGYTYDPFGYPVGTIFSSSNSPEKAPLPAPGSSFTFDQNGIFQKGVLTTLQCCTGPNNTGNSWWGNPASAGSTAPGNAGNIALNSAGQNMLAPCYSWQGAACAFPGRGSDVNAVTRYNHAKTMTEDGSVNLKWNPADNWKFNFDLQRVHSTSSHYDVEVGQYSFANLSINATGSRPTLTLLAPSNINQSPGGLSNPDNYRYNHVMDHVDDSTGTETAVRADGQYRFNQNWLDSVKFGVRYADRDQHVNYSTYNWGNIANDYNLTSNQYQFWNIDKGANGSFGGYPAGLYQVVPFGNNFFGGPTQNLVFFNFDALAAGKANLLGYNALGVGQDHWEPVCQRAGVTPGTCYLPGETDHVNEKTKAAYVELKFGGPSAMWNGIGVSGNIGVRYVETDDRSTGYNSFKAFSDPNATTCTPNAPAPPGAPPVAPGSAGCYLTPAQKTFSNGAFLASDVNLVHRNLLPSFNLKFDFGNNWYARFAASEGLSRPDMGLLKNYAEISPPTLPQNAGSSQYIKDSGGNITGITTTYQANAYNPYLKPETADQVDFTVEHYFGKVGQFSVDLFWKQFHNYIQYGTFNEQFTNGGVTNTVAVTEPVNGKGGSLEGAEVAYQRFFDFLPGPWSGLGVQANFTYVSNEGIKNSNLKVASGGSSPDTTQPGTGNTAFPVGSLEGLSKYAYNLVGMYEYGPWALRAAYNWRSKWLVTAVDCCVYLPMWQKQAGFLDASVRYRISDHVEFSLQGSNLLNTQTILRQQITAGGLLSGGSWFQNDRRVTIGVRFKY